MSSIYVNTIGNGSAWVDNPNPENGDIITIFAYADDGAQLLDLTMQDQNGAYIAIFVQPSQQLQYDGSWGDCTITATFSHDIITLHDNGNGYSYVSNLNPSDGETVYLTSVPDRKYMVFEIICSDSGGTVLWTAQAEELEFIYDASWGDITIDVYFEMKWIFKNLWILSRREWWRKNNY